MDYINIGNLTKASFIKRLLAWLFDFSIALGLTLVLDQYLLLPIFDSFWNLTGLRDAKNSIDSLYNSLASAVSSISNNSSLIASLNSEYETAVLPILGELYPKEFVYMALITFIIGTIFSFIIPYFLKNGQTLGKKLFKIAVATKDGTKISLSHLIRRYYIGAYLIETVLVYALMFLLIGNMAQVIWIFAALMVAFFPLGRTLHDYIGGTVVVDVSINDIMSEEEKEEYEKSQDNFRIKEDRSIKVDEEVIDVSESNAVIEETQEKEVKEDKE